MQSYRDQELIQTQQGSIAELLGKMPAQATHHIISVLPQSGEEVSIKGLIWIVERVNEQAGWMRLRLKRP